MLTDKIKKQLALVFSDADLLDVDFSRWDDVISIYVVADHVISRKLGKRVVFALRFRGVRRFDWSFRHHDFKKFPLPRVRGRHLEWNIYRCALARGEISELLLGGSEQFPELKIRFESVNIEEVSHSVFANVNPDWSKPGAGLARPSIEMLHRLFKTK